ncbi:hypothetical protein A2W14_07375 [Candidatus Gottesmanbacteria bacterium RBG_16_37_8]|uniref:Glycosyltransferase RgtA/B/C/D-like domain-containing protein n=1 Tax=Candidatus Gottesmanbacteria bacterium RBG_16_37_8 TaxID=1798371 RepID=A0A1F5YRV2_9BACT|nr:MAG: hypothetical protein A2W14_07375 [Candidatus Gottesmanbacteria bacterium RBG_16_37_8]
MIGDLIGLSLLLSIFLTTFNRGFFTFPSFFLVLFLTVILLKLYFQNLKTDVPTFKNNLKYIFLISYLLFLYFSQGIYQINLVPALLIDLLPLFFLPFLYLFIFKSDQQNKNRQIFWLFILLAITLRILTIIASPQPVIDVFVILKEAPLKLLSGINPYNTVYSRVYQGSITDYYPYWPYSFLISLPFVLFFKDPRVLLFLADIMTGILIYLWAGKNLQAKLLSLIYLFRPNSLFIIEQSWLTPLLSLLTLILFWTFSKTKHYLAGILMGILSGIQPLFLALIPLTFRLWRKKIRIAVTALLTCLLAVTPFFLWQPVSFIDKTILVYFKPLAELKTIPVHLSLNINTFFYTITGNDIPQLLSLGFLLILLIYLFRRGYRIIKSNSADFFPKQILLTTVFFYLFYLLFRQSFINYYYYAGSLVIFFIVFLSASDK